VQVIKVELLFKRTTFFCCCGFFAAFFAGADAFFAAWRSLINSSRLLSRPSIADNAAREGRREAV
jgi:hypothetical protein